MLKTRGWLLWLCLALFFYHQRASAQEGFNNSPKVRVKVASHGFPLSIQSEGLEVQGVPFENIKHVALMRSEPAQILLRNVGGQKIWMVKKDNETLRLSHQMIRLDSSSGKIKIGIHQYPSPIYLTAKNDKAADIVLSVPFEKYLEGVLVGEMSPTWPLEALKAQAVAARSYTLYQLSRRHGEMFQLQGDVLDQVYSLNSETPFVKNIRQALAETEGEVLTQGREVLKAYYHSDCGGETEEPQNVWGVANVHFGVAHDKKCATRSAWSFTVKKSDLATKLSEKFRLRILESVQVLSRTQSHRVALIAMAGGENRVTMTGQELRQLLGFDKIKSTLFSLTVASDSVTFQGRGSGHGSGLCQWGSRDLAKEGQTYEEILTHYYPRAQLTKINATHKSARL